MTAAAMFTYRPLSPDGFFETGTYYAPRVPSPRWGGAAAGMVLAYPFPLPRRARFDRVAVRALGHASATYRLGIYLPDGASGLPGTALFRSSADLGPSATEWTAEETIDLEVGTGTDHPALYVWVAVAFHGTVAGAVRVGDALDESVDSSVGSALGAVLLRGVTGALPATFGTPDGSADAAPIVMLRVA